MAGREELERCVPAGDVTDTLADVAHIGDVTEVMLRRGTATGLDDWERDR